MRHLLRVLVIFLFTTPLMAQIAAVPKRESVTLRGGTVVYVYSADGKQITGMEDDDCITDFIYNDAGVDVGHTVHPRGTNLALTVRYSNDRRFSADGMPSIEWISDHDGRDIEIRTGDGKSIAEYVYRKSGHTAQVTIGDRMTLKVSTPAAKKVTQTLTTHQGKKIRETIVPSGIGFIAHRRVLDVVSKDLGLDVDWAEKTKFRRSASDILTIVRDAAGDVILYLVGGGAAAVGFLPDGSPLFYDIGVKQAARPNLGWGSDAQPDVATDLSGVVPDHVVLTRSGMIGAYVSDAAEGAINSMWTERDAAGNVLLRHRSTSKSKAQNLRGITSSGSFASFNSRFLPVSEITCSEPFYETVCSYGDYVPTSCAFTSGTNYYECGGGDGGAPAGGGGGGGSTTAAGNQVTGDLVLKAKVSRSLSQAETKLTKPECSALLDNLTYGSGNTPLRAMMNARGYTSAGDYIAQALTFENGFSTGECDGSNCAYTQVYTRTVYVCSKLTQYSDTMAANLLIHEMLHTLGLPEKPPTTGAMTSSQITAEVVQACGT